MENLLRLSFPDDVFDLVSTNEVLEHVPDIDQALREIARMLRPGGWYIGTCPFAITEESVVRAKMQDGKLVVITEEYHEDPVDSGRSFVFELSGCNILQRARQAGFGDATWCFVHSPINALCEQTGAFVLRK
jgi:SAM-dependent methyltransferase